MSRKVLYALVLCSVLLTHYPPLLRSEERADSSGQGVKEKRSKSLETAKPRLVILLAVDQLRRDRLVDSLPGGLGQLLREGRVYRDAALNHGLTNTCPGHVVMLTGVNPGKAGVVGNSFINRETWEENYCVQDTSGQAGIIGYTSGGDSDHGLSDQYISEGRSPRLIKVSALGDWLKNVSSESRVFSVSAKDRAAITLGGKHPDGAFWFDTSRRIFTSSYYYMSALPEWLVSFNGIDPDVKGFMDEVPEYWEHSRGTYRVDDYHYEDDKFTRYSPHPLNKGDLHDIGEQVLHSPWIDKAVLDLSRELITEEKLGSGKGVDVLAVSLSATDTIGHLYGPYSSESEDALGRLDRWLGQWLEFIQNEIGKDRILLVLTSDHGVLEIPEWKKEGGNNRCPYEDGRAGLISMGIRVMSQVFFKFTGPFDGPESAIKFSGVQIYLNPEWKPEEESKRAELLSYVESYLEKEPFIKEVWNHKELFDVSTEKSATEIAALFRNSHNESQGGDLIVQPYEDCLIRGSYGTTHLSPYSYDRDIPLVFWGNGVKPAEISGEVHTIDIAPTLARYLDIGVPENLDGKPLDLH